MSANTESFQCPCVKPHASAGREAACIHTDVGCSLELTFNPNQVDFEKLVPDRLRTMPPLDLISLGYVVEGHDNAEGTEIRQAIHSRANEIPWPTFRFAIAGGHLDIADAAAPYTVGRLPTKEQCVHDLAVADQLAWYKYREQYLLLLDAVFAQPASHKNAKRKLHDCGGWQDYVSYVLGDLPNVSLFTIMSEVAEQGASTMFARGRWEKEIIPPGWDEECVTCRERADKWESAVNRRFRRLEKFSAILERLVFVSSIAMADDWGSIDRYGQWELTKHGSGLCAVGPHRCQHPVDVIFKSTEPENPISGRPGHPEFIGAHSAMLAEQGEGFPSPGDVTTTTEPVLLTEDGKTLRLLFIFMHSKDLGGPPIELLRKVAPKHLISLALAAEKYMVHHLVALCRLAIQSRVKEVPSGAFHYALKHDDSAISDLAAPLLIGEKEAEMLQIGMGRFYDIPAAKILRWFRWREGYLRLAEAILIQPEAYINSRDRPHDCGLWEPYTKTVLDCLPTTTFALAGVLGKRGAQELIDERWKSREHRDLVGKCRVCKERAEKWEENLNRLLMNVVPFSKIFG